MSSPTRWCIVALAAACLVAGCGASGQDGRLVRSLAGGQGEVEIRSIPSVELPAEVHLAGSASAIYASDLISAATMNGNQLVLASFSFDDGPPSADIVAVDTATKTTRTLLSEVGEVSGDIAASDDWIVVSVIARAGDSSVNRVKAFDVGTGAMHVVDTEAIGSYVNGLELRGTTLLVGGSTRGDCALGTAPLEQAGAATCIVTSDELSIVTTSDWRFMTLIGACEGVVLLSVVARSTDEEMEVLAVDRALRPRSLGTFEGRSAEIDCGTDELLVIEDFSRSVRHHLDI